MAKRQRKIQQERVEVPIYIPTADGQSGDIVLGSGEMRGQTLVIHLNDLIPAAAIKHRIERGGLVGITFLIPAEENDQHKANEDAIQEAQDAARIQEAKDLADLVILNTDDVGPEDLGN